ncbi:MAG TPA: ribonuclease P protein component [Terriglobales bacterium]|nr:ribonuclease P protein component [Terriglobales bacterium]
MLRRVDFLAVYDSGMRRGSPHFTIFGRLRAAAAVGAGDRFGITVTKKLGNSAVRNRLRRRTRELLRRLPGSGPACDFVIHPRPAAATGALPSLAEELAAEMQRMREALERAGTRPA